MKKFPKTTLLLVFLSLFIHSKAQAQVAQIDWVKGAGGSNIDAGQSITTDSSGNVYVTGCFASASITFGTTTLINDSVGYADMYVVKYNSFGNVLWAKSTGGINSDYATGISTDASGNVYVTGYFASASITFGSTTLTNAGVYDIYVVKYDINGNVLWATSAGGSIEDYGLGISTDAFGNVYVTGSFYSPTITFGPYALTNVGYADVCVVKYDASGNVLWAKNVGGSGYDSGQSITTDASGNLYVTGNFGSPTITFDSTVLTNANAGHTDMYVVKYDASGNTLWARSSGGTYSDYGTGINTDASGNVYVTGGFQSSSITFGSNTLTNGGICNMYVVKYDASSNVLWAKSVSNSTNTDIGNSICIDASGNVYVTGLFQSSSITFGSITLTNANSGWEDMYVLKYTTDGGELWARSAGGSIHDSGNGISTDASGNVYVTGKFNSPTLTFGSATLNNNIGNDMFVVKYSQPHIYGTVFNDINGNCMQDNEPGLAHSLAVVNPGNVLVETNVEGYWGIDSLPAGNYTITYSVPNHWDSTCAVTQSFTVVNPAGFIHASDFGIVSTQPCAQPDVTIIAPFLRRCFSNQIVYVQACNKNMATGALNAAYVDVELDSLLTPTSASLSYTSLGNNQYRFNVGTLNPGQCVNFTINTTVSCAANLQQTLCMAARLFPADSCVFDTIPATPLPVGPGTVTPCNLPWDRSSLSVDGYCANDTVYFTVTNNGSASNGNMLCYAPVRVYVDGVLSYTDSIMLGGGQTITYSYLGNGQTWILQADQHPLHPGNSHPNAHVEACGNIANWTPGLVNNLPLDDADPIVDIYCGVVSGSYDPNDKTGFPTGLGTQHEILPNQQLQYLIRFQNTGTDTAFNIVVRDTLDTDLNIFSVVPGVASHNYSFRMYGPRVLEWTFNNIMLPDSNVNEATSHGFLTFRVDQQPNLLNGTKILNDADIYFDFNAPVITNQTVHTINNWINAFPVGVKTNIVNQTSTIKVYPNPTTEMLNVEIANLQSSNLPTLITIENMLGQVVYTKQTTQQLNQFNISTFVSGVYFIKVVSGGKTEYVKLLKL